jgi:hypothetical protein
MIYTDGIHLISDTSLQELHSFAQKAGIPETGFRPHLKHPHYRLEQRSEIRAAVVGGAETVPTRFLVLALKKARPFVGQPHDCSTCQLREVCAVINVLLGQDDWLVEPVGNA